MRLFESILLLALVALTYQLIFSQRQDAQKHPLLLFAIIIALIHIFVEGYRWQMAPAYLSLGFLYFRMKIGVLQLSRRFHKVGWGTWIVFVILQPAIVPVIKLPSPTGPHIIGTETFHLIDSSRSEWFTPEIDNDFRELMVQVWYPASSKSGEPIPYLDNLSIRKKALADAGGLPTFLVSHIDLTKTHSYENASIKYGTYPLLVFSHGITGYRQLSTSLIEDLASHGYIVAALDHTYDCNLTVFTNGKTADYRSDITGHPDSVQIRRQQLNTRVADIRFIINSLFSIEKYKKNISPYNIGVLGHSYGGATSIQAAYEDNRIHAALTLDSWMNPVPDHIINDGIDQPFLYIGRPHWNDSDYPNSPDRLTRFSANLSNVSFHYILEGSRHLDFCDAPLFSPLSDFFLETGTIPAKRAVFIINTTVRSFFDKHLKNESNDFPNNLNKYPELLLQ